MVWIKPSFSEFWLSALGKKWIPAKPWNQLFPEEKVQLYIYSILSLFMGIGAAYALYEMAIGKLPY